MEFRITIRIQKHLHDAIRHIQEPYENKTFFLWVLPHEKPAIEHIAEDFLSSINANWKCSMQIIDITEMDSMKFKEPMPIETYCFEVRNLQGQVCIHNVSVRCGDNILETFLSINNEYVHILNIKRLYSNYDKENVCTAEPLIEHTYNCPEHGMQVGNECWCGHGGAPDDAGYHPNMRIPKKRKVVSDECQHQCELEEVEVIDADIINTLHNIFSSNSNASDEKRKKLANAAYEKLMEILGCGYYDKPKCD